MQRCMKEQRSIKLHPHEATAERYSMLFIALPRTLAVFTGIGFSNPDQAWAQALKEDGESARWQPPNRHPKRHDPCSRESPNGSQRRLTSRLVSRRPYLCQGGGSPMDSSTEEVVYGRH
jgi:hypothetical protein